MSILYIYCMPIETWCVRGGGKGKGKGGCVIQNYLIARWGCEVDEVMKSNLVFSIDILQDNS